MTALATGISTAGITGYQIEEMLASAEDNISTSDSHDYNENGFCKEESCDAPYEKAVDSDGDGTYEISNAGQLYWFAGLVNGTLTDGTAKNNQANAVLTSDIAVNEGTFSVDVENKNYDVGYTVDGVVNTSYRDWTPIGYNTWFIGNFDGQGHTVSGLYTKAKWSDFTATGLIGKMTKTVKKLDRFQ